ncbi:PAS domain S-box protein [Rufibacter roseus]|uniref:histidine kinase n=1 Tax=Rufibacter roseus TaxID=1567108 RepID=A0ABW2DFU0_9BACT|nr:PAS domain S-box protein [Rufibacter roseus]
MPSDLHLLTAVIDTIDEGVVIQNQRGEYLELNQQAAHLLQLTREQLLGKTPIQSFWGLIKEDGSPFPFEKLPNQITLQTGQPQKDILIGVTVANKVEAWVKTKSRKLTVQGHEYILTTFLDVTEQYTLADELWFSEARWQLAVDGSELGVWDWDGERNVAYFSPTWKSMLGYQDHEIPNDIEEWKNRIHPDDHDRVMGIIKELYQGKSPAYHIEHRLRCKDGTYKWILTSGKAITRNSKGLLTRLVGTHRDVHAGKVLQEQLRLSEQKLSKTFQFSSVGLALVSPTGEVLDANPALCQILGYTKEELLHLDFQQLTHPDDIEPNTENIRKLLNKEIESYQVEKRYIHKNKQIIWGILSISLIWDSYGTPSFFVSQLIDITHTKKLISDLEANNNTLYITSQDLKSKIRQLEEFNRIVSHNLRGPASNIQLLLDMLPVKVPGTLESPTFKMLQKSSETLNSTLADLMTILEVRMNKNIAFDHCQFKQTLEKVYALLQAQIINKNVKIEEKLEQEYIHYPSVYLESILYNLLSNAIKYSQLEVLPVIKIHTYVQNGETILTVKDNGLGINLDRHRNDIFKLKKVFHKGFDSRGVGLFIVKNQLETLGGSISVKSKPMAGSKFTVKF